MKLRFIALFVLIQKEPKKSRPSKNLLKILTKKRLEKNSLRSNSFSRFSFFLRIFRAQIFNGLIVYSTHGFPLLNKEGEGADIFILKILF